MCGCGISTVQADDGSEVRIDWIMTTTGVDAPANGVDSRVSTGVFSLSEDPASQLILQGVALYPDEDATLVVSSSTDPSDFRRVGAVRRRQGMGRIDSPR